jgi:hypothetical protein
MRDANSGSVQLLKVDPELARGLDVPRAREAAERLYTRAIDVPRGRWTPQPWLTGGSQPIGLLVLEGLLVREATVSNHPCAELLGPGDLLRPWQTPTSGLLPVDVLWSVLSPSSFAVLDRRFAAELARWPEVTAALFDRLSERSLRLATTQAISQLTRVDRRLKALLWHLAERWGRVSGDGVIVPLALTHRILGQLVGARRPTVSTALGELAERGELTRRFDGSWVLRGSPPDASALGRRRALAGRPGDLMRPMRRFSSERDDDDVLVDDDFARAGGS